MATVLEPQDTLFTIRLSYTHVWGNLEWNGIYATYTAKGHHPMQLKGPWASKDQAVRDFIMLKEYVERMPSGRKGWTYQIIWEA